MNKNTKVAKLLEYTYMRSTNANIRRDKKKREEKKIINKL